MTRIAAVAGAFIFSVATAVHAEGPDSFSGKFGGIFKVASSTDPSIPASPTNEYFFDFGKGIQGSKLSGSVAVSVRRNPNVKVRIMAWQYFPDQGVIVIGNPYAEGSRKAVAKAAWRMKNTANGFIFERGGFQVVLHRADPKDY